MKKSLTRVIAILLFAASAAFADEHPASSWAVFEGQKIHYYDIGEERRSALVFIHGWACNGEFWRESYREFPDRRVIVIDLIGHGKSDKPKTEYTMELFARSVAAVLAQAKVRKAVLVGHSMGTPVSRQFYRLYPKRTKAIVIVDGPLRSGNADEMAAFFEPFRRDFSGARRQMVLGMTDPIKDEKLRMFINESMLSTPVHVASSAIEAFAGSEIWDEDPVSVPVLALMADSGGWQPDEGAYFKRLAADLDFRMWAGVSHFLMMERPKDFNRALEEFIRTRKLL